MNQAHTRFSLGTAFRGVCVNPPTSLSPVRAPSVRDQASLQELSIKSYETYLNPAEQRFYDWSIGILEDGGVVGSLEVGDVYLSSSFQAQIYTGAMPLYTASLTRTCVEFAHLLTDPLPIQFEAVFVDNDEEVIEATQVGRAFRTIRRQSAYLRAWKESTQLASTSSTLLSDLRIVDSRIELDMEVLEAGQFTVAVCPTARSGMYEYYVRDNDSQYLCSPSIADVILNSAAKGLKARCDPSTIVCAMIRAGETLPFDCEWVPLEPSHGS
jgi:hypothetical protein